MSGMEIFSEYSNLTVNIKLDEGVYVFDGRSGTGKTFLAKVLLSICSIKKIKYRYFNNTAKDDDPSVIVAAANNKDLVFFDNADLYLTKDILKEIKGTKCILISIKDVLRLNIDYKDCDVQYNGKSLSLEVY